MITDLDEAAKSEDEDEYASQAEPHPDASDYGDSNGDYSISSVLMDHLNRQNNPLSGAPDAFSLATKPPNSRKEGALILYQPPPALHHPQPSPSDDKNEETPVASSFGVELPPPATGGEDDAMDIDS